jgi:hypothetical protein
MKQYLVREQELSSMGGPFPFLNGFKDFFKEFPSVSITVPPKPFSGAEGI